jgi:AAA family ATP:ADP antiporter
MPTKRSTLDRLLGLFAPVRKGEGASTLVLFACVFAIMCAYYILKTAREALLLSGGSFGLRGDELKAYASGVMAVLLLGIVPAYGALANRVKRMKLIWISYAIVVACLVAFWVLAELGVPIALAFFVYIGIISVFLIAQFWSYANDIYTEEQGKRLFTIVATGGAAGAIAGPQLANLWSATGLMLISGGFLVVALGLFAWVDHRLPAIDHREKPIAGKGGFVLVLKSRYLLAIAAMVIVSNLVNSVGEFLLANRAADLAAEVAHGAEEKQEVIKSFYGNFYFWVNLIAFVVQAFVVWRIIEHFGIRGGLLVLPLVALAAYGSIAAVGGLAIVRTAKIAENATDYSVQNTTRQALFLPTSRSAKYKAKAAIDTFFTRFGDALSALVVLVGLHELKLAPRQLAIGNLALVGLWFGLVIVIARRYRACEETDGHEAESVAPGVHA